MSTKLKLIVNNPELLPDAFLDKVIEYYNTEHSPICTHSDLAESDRIAIARWFGEGCKHYPSYDYPR